MEQSYIDSPAWRNALTLNERIAGLRGIPEQNGSDETRFDHKRAERRLERWRSQAPFVTESYFTQWLEAHQLAVESLLHLLGEPVASLHERHPGKPEWLAALEQAFSHPVFADLSGDPLSGILSYKEKDSERKSILVAIAPLIRQGLERFRQGVKTLQRSSSYVPFDADTVENLLLPHLAMLLVEKMSRTFVLEVNVARLQGVLQGDTPEARFHDFVNRLTKADVVLNILQEYPVMARQLVISIDHWVNYSLEVLRHLCDDWPALIAMLALENDPGKLSQIAAGAGDTHHEGRSVIIAHFSSGFKLVYKPHSLQVDIHFADLLSWLNRRGSDHPFRAAKVLDRETHGWTEFVHEQDCAGEEEIRRFYERIGGYLALLYVLEATDFHFENLIACGEHPILVDLESLFHARLDQAPIDQNPIAPAGRAWMNSVMRSGLLPQWLWANDDSDGVDMSGIGGESGQLTPDLVPTWEDVGTDAMRLVGKRMAMPASKNRPKLGDVEIDAMKYTDSIMTGFSSIYKLLMANREALLAEDGPIAAFADDPVRIILRATRSYALLLQASYHPDVQRDALERDRLFARLGSIIEKNPRMAQVIPAEKTDLELGDIPAFSSRPGSRDLWTSRNECIADFFDETSLDCVRRRLHELNEDDLARQLWIIQASMSAHAMEHVQELSRTNGADQQPAALSAKEIVPITGAGRSAAVESGQLLRAARAVADRLEWLAFRDQDEIGWLGVSLINERAWRLQPLGLDLYNGSGGIALFMAYLGALTGEERYTALAKMTLSSLLRQYERLKSVIKADDNIGAFSGLGGLIYVMTHAGMLLNEPAWFDQAEALVDAVSGSIDKDDMLDVIGGSAGCLLSLIGLYRAASKNSALAAAIQCGDHLIARAQPMARGIAWQTKMKATKPLTGLSHGASGMGLALMELAALTGEARFRKAAIDAIAYERSTFVPEMENWPDFRDHPTASSDKQANNKPPDPLITWCHGAPGIGLARLHSLRYFKDEETHNEINVALKTTLRMGFGQNHCLCHGDLGNLELLLQASQTFEDSQWRVYVDEITSRILDSISRHKWICGIPMGVETPGLMTGLAGIGYGLLRLAAPERVPPVLVLAPPILG